MYISLTNLRGSTIDPPTIVRSQVLLAVGINPSRSRMKQLAQTITGPHAKNLGLNNTVFGRVKQVSLSSNWTRLLGGPDAGSPSPSPAPLPHHSHHRDTNLAPAFSPSSKTGKSGHVSGEKSPSPTPTPAPVPSPHLHKIPQVKPPACPFGPKGTPPSKTRKQNHMAPPVYAPNAAPASSLKPHREAPTPSPHEVPTPSPSPLPNVVNARVHPPSGSNSDAEPPDKLRLVSHIPSSGEYSNLIRKVTGSIKLMLIFQQCKVYFMLNWFYWYKLVKLMCFFLQHPQFFIQIYGLSLHFYLRYIYSSRKRSNFFLLQQIHLLYLGKEFNTMEEICRQARAMPKGHAPHF